MNKEIWMHSETILAMIAEIRAQYPEDVFTPPKKGSPPDAYGAAGARLACDSLRRKLEEHLENEDLP